jgi:hypothetical protein
MEKNKIMADKDKKTPDTLPADFDFENAPETLPADFSFDDSPKSTAPSKIGGESGAQNTPYSSSESALKSWTTEANPLANKGVQVPLAKPIDGVEQTKIVQPKLKAAELGKGLDLFQQQANQLNEEYKANPTPELEEQMKQMAINYKDTKDAYAKAMFEEKHLGGSIGKKKVEDESIASDLYNSFKAGSEALGASLANTPSFLYDVFALPQNLIAKYTGLNVGASADQFAKDYNIPKNEVAAAYIEAAKQTKAKIDEKYDKSITEYISDGDYGKATKMVFNSVAESLPITLSLMAGNYGGVTPLASTMGGSVVFGAEKKQQLDQENPNLDEATKTSNALSTGLFEGIFENFGLTKLGGIAKEVFAKQGKEAAQDIAKQSFREVYAPLVKKYVGVGAGESISEMETQFANNVVDKYSGVKPDLDLRDGVIEAGLIGLASSGSMSAPVAAVDVFTTKQARAKAKENAAKIQSIEADISNPLVSDEVKETLSNEIGVINTEMADLKEAENELVKNVPIEKREAVAQNWRKIDALEESLPNLSDDAKKAVEAKIIELENENNLILATPEVVNGQPQSKEEVKGESLNETVNQENTKQGDVIYDKDGNEYTVIGFGKSRKGSDIVEVETKKLTDAELLKQAQSTIWSRNSGFYPKGITKEFLKDFGYTINQEYNDLIKARESSKGSMTLGLDEAFKSKATPEAEAGVTINTETDGKERREEGRQENVLTPTEEVKGVVEAAPLNDKGEVDLGKQLADKIEITNESNIQQQVDKVSSNVGAVGDIAKEGEDVESTAKALEGKGSEKLIPLFDVLGEVQNSEYNKQQAIDVINTEIDILPDDISDTKDKERKEQLQKRLDYLSDAKNKEKEIESLFKELEKDSAERLSNSNKKVSEAYHKAKADGSNPELVKAVESLLSKEQTPQPKNETKENEGVEVKKSELPSKPKKLFATMGGQSFEVQDFQEAAEKKAQLEKMPQEGRAYGKNAFVQLKDENNNDVGYIDWSGRIWKGTPNDLQTPENLLYAPKGKEEINYTESSDKSLPKGFQVYEFTNSTGKYYQVTERFGGAKSGAFKTKQEAINDFKKEYPDLVVTEQKTLPNETKNTAITADAGQVQPTNVDSEVAKDDTKGEVKAVELKEKTPVLNGSEKSLLKKFLKFIEQRQGERTYQNMSVQKFKDAYNALPKSVKDFISSDLNGKIRAYEGGISDSETPSFSNQFMPQLFGTKKVYGEDVETTEGTIDTKKISLLSKENNVNNNIKTDEGEVIAISPKFKKGAENRKGALSDFEDAILNLDESIGDNDIRNKDIMKKRRELSNLLNDRNFYNDLAKSDNLQEILDKYNIKISTEKKTLDGEVKANVKEKAAKGFISVALNKLTKSLKDFQGRGKEYSQQTYDRIVNEAKSGALNISSIPPIQIWKDKSGNWVILGGHSRTKAFEDLAAGKHELNPKYKKSDFANISAQIVEANTLEEAQKIAQESNQGAVQTVVDNAKYVREKLLPTFKSFNEAKTKLKDLYGAAWTRIYAYANLNPNGKAMTFLKAFSENLESESTDISRKMAEWTGKAMTDFKGLTNEHENEIFEYLLENNKIKTYNEFYDILNRRINGIDGFVASEPLNFGAKVGRGSNEAAVIKEIQEAKAEKKRVEDEIKKVQKTETDKNKRDKTISELTKEAIRLNTLIGDLEKKQAQAKEGDALQFNLFNDLNEQIENGNINAEQAEQFLDGTNEVEPIVASIESKAASDNETELNEAIQEADNLINEVKQEKELNKPKSAKEVAKENLDKAREAFRKTRGGLQSSGLGGIPEFINLVKAAIEYGYVSSKEFLKEFRNDIDTKYSDSEVEAAFDNIVNPPSGEKPKKKKKKRKSLLNRAFKGTSDEKVKKAIEKYGLFYETENQAEAQKDAKDFVREVGDEAALDAVRKNLVEGGRAAFIFAQVIDNVMIDMANAKNIQEAESLLAIQGELLDEFDRRARAGGQFNAALNLVYQTADFNYSLERQIKKYKDMNNGVIPKEVEAKMNELEAQFKEVNEKLKEAEKRAKEAEEKAAIENIKEDVNRGKDKETYSQKAKKTADKFRAKFKTKPKFYDENGNEIEVFTAGFTWNDLVELAAKAIEKTGNVADGLKAVSEFVQESDVYKKLTKKGQAALDKQINDYFSEDKTQGRIKVPHSLIRRLVEEGNTDIDSLVAAVKKEIAEEYPDATDREIRDAITGYGKTVNQNQEEIEKTIRALKFIGKSQSILEDIAMKKRPLKSGAQRDKLTADERKLLKQIKEAMKDLPVDLETQEAQLKTALDAAKTRLTNRIEDLNREIQTGELAKKNNKPMITDQEYDDLVAERDRLKAIHQETFKKGGMIMEEKIANALKALDKAIEETDRKIAENDLAFKTATKLSTPEIEAKREQLNKSKELLKQLRQEAGIIEARRLENAKNSVKRRIAELERRIREKDFSKKKPTPLIKDNELIKLNAQKLRIKGEFDKLQYQNELNQRNSVRKFYDGALEVWGLPRALLATGEFSFMLIQGGIYTLGNWRLARSSFATAMKALANENRAKQQLKYIQAQDFYPIMKASKLALTEPDAKLEAREEQFLGGWVNYIWDVAGYPAKLGGEKLYEGWKKLNPIRAVERAGVSYLNMLRVQKFLEGQEMLLAQGKTFETHPKDYKNLADVVNTFTGRASLGRGEQFSKELSAVFFSPRNWASMIKQASPYALYHIGKMGSREEGQSSLDMLMKGKVKPSVAQKMAVKDFLKYSAITAGFIAMAAIKYNNDDDDETEVSFNPISSDFLKIKIGNTRIDMWGGKIQQVILTNRIIASLVGVDGKSLDYAGKMIVNKFNPSAAMTYKYLKAEKDADGLTYIDQYGNPISMKEDLWNSVLPIYWQSFSEINKENPTTTAGLLHLYAFLGGGTQTYVQPMQFKDTIKDYFKEINYKPSIDKRMDEDFIDLKGQPISEDDYAKFLINANQKFNDFLDANLEKIKNMEVNIAYDVNPEDVKEIQTKERKKLIAKAQNTIENMEVLDIKLRNKKISKETYDRKMEMNFIKMQVVLLSIENGVFAPMPKNEN